MGIVDTLLPLLVVHQGIILGIEGSDRSYKYSLARELAGSKPMLVVGRPKGMEYDCADVTLDLDPLVLSCPNGVVADVRDIPFQDKYFGSAYVSHVLEHLPTTRDAFIAWDELWRVSDNVIVSYPRWDNLIAILHPDHHLWIEWDEHNPLQLKVSQR